MTQERIERHLEISDLLIRWAEEEIETGELFLASEMAWGAVAHYLKSVAKYRGWPNETHRDLSDIVTDLAYETYDPQGINDLYELVNRLYVNFYEDWLLDKDVADGLNDAEELIARLESRNRPPSAIRPSGPDGGDRERSFRRTTQTGINNTKCLKYEICTFRLKTPRY